MKSLGIVFIMILSPLVMLGQHVKMNKDGIKHGPIIGAIPDTVKLGEIFLDELDDGNGKVQLTVVNQGNKPLILTRVSGCCGTNIKSWPKAPILPNQKGTIEVYFRIENRPQRISRTVTIESNAANSPVVKVPIIGVVVERKAKNELTL
ncbi:MAG: DUF1573 domain-containing protein [Bacteroidales bacterium]|nr:DUF1573 domain-containing protein [Bacteroidales bacterium]